MRSLRLVGLLLIALSLLTGVEALCHGGWSQYGSSCYLFNSGPVTHTWSDSRMRCQQQDADLVTIDTTQEMNWILGQTNRYIRSRPPIRDWWTGLYAPSGGDTWQWPNASVTDINILHSRWAQGQPNRTSVNQCVEVQNNRFRVTDCTLPLHAICERSAGKPMTCDPGWNLDSGMCYMYVGGPQTYDGANLHCKNAGATLARVSDVNTQKAVYEEAINHKQNIWIALRSVTTRGGGYHWVWPDGSVLSQGYWATTPPQSLGGNVNKTCVEQTQNNVPMKSWHPITCDQRRAFVCQKPEGSCPPGWLQYANKCFNIYTRPPKSFTQAQGFCQGLGGDLMALDSWDLVQYVWPYVRDARSAGAYTLWIGLTDYNEDIGPWKWVAGNKTVSWTNWPSQDQLNTRGHQDCVTVDSSDPRLQWRPIGNCDLLKTFICQLPVNKALQHPTQPPKHYTCPSGFRLYQRSGTCLQLNQHDRSWNDARADCKRQGADLVIISNSRLNGYIRGQVSAHTGTYWIGLHDRSQEGQYHWLDNTARATYLYWHSGQPNNGGRNENCVAIHPQDSFKWWDDNCATKYNYICQQNAIVNGHTPPTTTHGPWSTKCGPLWEEDPNSNSCYLFVTDRLSWLDALDTCHSNHGDLLAINSVTEQFYINGRISSLGSNFYWVGANDRQTESGWRWTNNSPMAFINWKPHEPNNGGNSDCVAIAGTDGRWSDFHCNARYGYICEKQAAGFTTRPTPRPTSPAHVPSGKVWGCGRGWRGYSGQCYVFRQSRAVTWSTAKTACGGMGGALVSIHSGATNNFVYSMVPRNYHGSVWLGLNDVKREGSWEWSDMSSVTFTLWKTHEPNNGNNGDCVAFSNSKYWADYNCKTSGVGAYICMKPMGLQDAADIALSNGCRQGLGYRAQCYVYVDSPFRTWTSAQRDCRRRHGNLATVNDRQIQAFVSAELLSRSTPYWIGLNNTGPLDNAYRWTTNVTLDFTYWGSNHTGNEVGKCVAMTPGRPAGLWQNVPCTRSMPYICELPRQGFTTPPPTTPTTQPRPSCAQGWVTMDTLCVRAFNVTQSKRLSWMEARVCCQKLGGDLLDVRSKEMEDDIIIQVFHNTTEGDWWIGLNDRDSENGHVWSDGQGTVYTHWLPGEPNDYNNREDCVTWHFPTNGSSGWRDTNCYVANRFICYVMRSRQASLSTTPVPPTGVTSSLCPNNSWQWLGGDCYLFSPVTGSSSLLSWYDARRLCQSLHADLVSVHSSDINGFLTTAMSKSQRLNFWLGLNQLSSVGYSWTDGSPVDFVSWDINEPDDDNGGEKCVESNSLGVWNDNNCMDLNGYICKQLPKGATLSTPTLPPVTGGCPNGFTSAPFLEKCYFVGGVTITSRLNFTEAIKFCQRHVTPAGTLLSIHYSLEQRFVTSLIGNLPRPVWLGLNAQGSRNFEWHDNSEVDFDHWGPGEPDVYIDTDQQDDRRVCVAMNTRGQSIGTWNDMNCGAMNPFICQVNRVASLPVQPAGGQGCRAGYTKRAGLCYKYFPTPQTWAQAKATCQHDGGTLATPFDPNQKNVVGLMRIPDRQHVNNINDIWIGMSFVGGTTFQWVNHWPVIYTPWANDEPDNTGQCVKMDSSFFWHDHPCTSTYPFVCQQGGSAPSTVPPVIGVCDEGWSAHGQYCYLLVNTSRSWPEAGHVCQQLGSALLSVHSKAEMDFANILAVDATTKGASSAVGVWLGLSKAIDNGFGWSDDTEVDFDSWDQGEPSDSDGGQHQDCVQYTVTSGKWNDVDCFSHNYFMCKTLQVSNVGTANPQEQTVSNVGTANPQEHTVSNVGTANPQEHTVSNFSTANPQKQTGSSGGGSGGLSGGAVAGIVIGAAGIIAIAILVGLLLRGRLPSPTAQSGSENQGSSFDNALYVKGGNSGAEKDSVSFGTHADVSES